MGGLHGRCRYQFFQLFCSRYRPLLGFVLQGREYLLDRAEVLVENPAVPLLLDCPDREHGERCCSFDVCYTSREREEPVLHICSGRPSGRVEGGLSCPGGYSAPDLRDGAVDEQVRWRFQASLAHLAKVAVFPAAQLQPICCPDTLLQEKPDEELTVRWRPAFPHLLVGARSFGAFELEVVRRFCTVFAISS